MSVAYVTGRTFEHRERLKQLGGKFDQAEKRWIIPNATGTELDIIRQLVGCIVNIENQRKTPAPTREPVDIDIDTIVSSILSGEERDQAEITSNNQSAIYGDCQRFHNYFKDKNPVAFFGFTSLSALVDYVERIPAHVQNDPIRDDGWETHQPKWHGTPDMAAALRLARDGWSKGYDLAQQIVERLSLDHAQQRRRAYGVAGGSVSVGRMLAGNPAHMRKRPKQPGRKVVTIFTETFMSNGVSASNAIIRAGAVAAMVDLAEQQGYSCEVIAVLTTTKPGAGSIGHHGTVTLKDAGERLNLNDLVFALGHPSFFRRLMFAVVANIEECAPLWGSQGYPAQAFNKLYPTKANEFYIKQLSWSQQNRLDNDADEIERAIDMLQFVQPDNFPLELRK